METCHGQIVPLERLQMEVERRIANLEPLRTVGNHLQINVQSDGVVEVSGPVQTRLMKEMVLQSIKEIPGVLKVEDGMVADPDLELAIAQALATDNRTSEIPLGQLFVHSHSGVINLVGKLPDEDQLPDVLDVVSSVKGVRDVKTILQT